MKVPLCSTGLGPFRHHTLPYPALYSNSQSCKAGQRVSLTTYCPWATCCLSMLGFGVRVAVGSVRELSNEVRWARVSVVWLDWSWRLIILCWLPLFLCIMGYSYPKSCSQILKPLHMWYSSLLLPIHCINMLLKYLLKLNLLLRGLWLIAITMFYLFVCRTGLVLNRSCVKQVSC